MSLGLAIGVAAGMLGYASLIEGRAAEAFAPQERSSAVTACPAPDEQAVEPEPLAESDCIIEPAHEQARVAEPPPPEPAPEVTPPVAVAPELPLPRFPGSVVMDTRARWDEDKSSWLLVHALRVPASLSQVEGFYAKALEGAGMAVQMLGRTIEQGATRSILRGRSPTAHVQISLERPEDQLQTRIRLIWRQWN